MTYEIKPNAIMYYGMNDQHPNNIIIETTLSEDIVRDVMEEAINTALRRYPYFAVKLKELEDRFVLEENSNRVKLHDELRFNSSDDFLFCIAVTGATLKVILIHALTDIHGFMPFIKTILAEYYNKLNGCNGNYSGINSADSEVTEEEFAEPLNYLPDNISIGKQQNAPVAAYSLPEANSDSSTCHEPSGGYPYYLSLNNNSVKEFVKSMGGSFTSTISALFVKAITEVHKLPEDQKIVCTNIIDRKTLLGCPGSHYLSMHPASYAIDTELLTKPLNEIVTAIRNDLHEKMKTDVFVLGQQMKQFIDYLSAMPSTKQKQQMCQQIVNSKQSSSTFTVSYAGVVDFDKLNDKVQHVHIQGAATPILIEACAHRDVFDITFMQSMKSDVYFNAFVKVLNDYGLLVSNR